MEGFIVKLELNNFKINNIDTILIDETGDDIPMVSVTMITYNHQAYIAEAIESVLMQKTNFKFVLVIGEDCGTDKTREIILEYQRKYPQKIILKLPKSNLGMMENSISNKMFCNGKYIAECEGDDYWTDPLKLQKQVDFLEKNQDFVISCSNSQMVNSEGSFIRIFNENEIPEITDINYILTHEWYIPTASAVFRNMNIIELPKWFWEVLNGDYSLYLILTANGGLVHYVNEARCNYRLHENGVSNIFKSEKVYHYSKLFIYKKFNIYSNRKYTDLLKKKIERHSINIIKSLPILSKEFWRISFHLFWFDKTLSKKYVDYFIRRLFKEMKILLKIS